MNNQIKNEQPSDLELFTACCCAMVDIYQETKDDVVITS